MAPTNVRVPFGKLDRALRARARLAEKLEPRILEAREKEPAGLLGQLAHHKDEGGAYLPVDDVTQHLLLLFWAGYDTTASAGSWVLHELARRVDWQERLRDEAREWDGGADAGKLQATNWFLLEVERMFPSALFFPRIAVSDVVFDRYRIPKGTPVFYSPYMSHRDPASFEDPNAFNPERWNPARKGHPSPAKLFGFGGGPRICLGKSFAKLQLKLMIKALLTRYHLEPDPLASPKILALPVHHPVGSRVRFRPL
jgi:cytochrome P450